MLFLLLGFYFVFPACNIWLQLRQERGEPYELAATLTRESIDLNALQQLKDVNRVSPVLRLDAELSVEDYRLQCEVKAVYSSFLALKFTEGMLFPDSSNMPYLVLNEAAAKAFTLDRGTQLTVSANTEVLLSGNEMEQKGVVCGIFADESESPVVYMSYDTASRALPQSASTELLLSVTHKGAGEDVVKAIRRLGLNASFDANESLRWDMMGQQVWQLLLTGMGFMTCAAIMIRKDRSQELETRHGEITCLIVSGMTEKETNMIFPLRMALVEVCCMGLAMVIAGVTAAFSWLAVGICAVIIVICIVTMLLRRYFEKYEDDEW